MKDHVDDLLKLWRSSTFVWGRSDCMLSIADYAVSRGCKDITNAFRGLYASESEALAVMAAAGGPAAIIDRVLERTVSPTRGDIVLLNFSEGVGAVHTGDSIAVRLERGLAEINLKFASFDIAWKVP